MRNAAFCLLTEAEKNSKFRAILNDKTERTLTAEEMGSILLCVSPHKQCSIVVHNDADKSCNCQADSEVRPCSGRYL